MDPVLPYAPPCDRNLDPDTTHGIAIMLDHYCAWINAWLDNDPWPNEHRYTPIQFLDNKPDAQLYGNIEIAAIYDSTDHTVLALRIHDGDEGGPHGLTGWWDEYPVWSSPNKEQVVPVIVGRTVQLQHMTQEFDTHLSVIMQDGTLTYHGQDHPSKT